MDLGVTIVGGVIIAACVLPFVIMGRNKMRREKKMLQSLSDLAKSQNCTISSYEFCGDFVIGIDEDKKVSFFYKNAKGKETLDFVNLSDIHTCKSNKVAKTTKDSNGNTDVHDVVELCFVSNNKANQDHRFILFNEEDSIRLSGELQVADKWSALINNRLKAVK